MKTSKLPRESTRTTSLLGHLRKRWPGSYWIKIHGSPFQPRIVDIVGCWQSRFVALEVKRPGNQPTPKQWHTLGELDLSGAITGVVWTPQDCDLILESFSSNLLDTLSPSDYLGPTSDTKWPQKNKGESSIMTNRRTATKAPARKSTKVEEPEDELDDLEDLDDLDDFEDEEEEEDDEEEEEETPRTRNDRRQAAAKASTKPSKVTTKTPAKTAKVAPARSNGNRGNAANLVGRKPAEGMVGASDLAREVGAEPRAIRIILRKQKVAKSDNGLYEWKTGSKAFNDTVKMVKKELAAAK